MRSSEWTRRALIGLALFAIVALQHLTPTDRIHWHYLFPRLYYLPIIFAALYDGWRGGMLAAIISGAAFLRQFPAPEDLLTGRHINTYIELISFCSVAVLTGVLADRQRRQKHEYKQLAQQLSDVYSTLQTNFEGMKRAERLSAIGQLSAGLAHEIRNPLASIAGAAAILQRTHSADAKTSRCIAIIDSECKRLNGLLTNFLNFARPRPPKFQTVAVDGLLDRVIELAQHAIGRNAIDLRRRVDAEMPPLECDPEQITQVLLNLVINAIEASGEGAAVTLAAEHADGAVTIRVVDEGSGVAPEDIDKLFDPFFTTKETGTGLGLPVAHQIVGQMGGLLTAQRNRDRGMTFSITFPAKQRRVA